MSRIGSLWGPTNEDLRRFQAGMGSLKNNDFGVTSDNPRRPLGCCWVITC